MALQWPHSPQKERSDHERLLYSDSLTTEMIKNTLLRVPNTIKEAVKNNAIVL